LRTETLRLTLVISSLVGGGAERALTILANAWANRGNSVTLVTLDGKAAFFSLDGRVVHRSLAVAGHSPSLTAAVANNFRRVSAIRRAVRESEPVAVISFIETTNVLTLLATRGLDVPVIVSERSDPAHFATGWAIGVLRRLLYPFADAVVVQTADAGRFFSSRVQRRLRVIPNPVLPSTEGAVPASIPENRIVALGRLSKEKGFDLLVDAFSRVAAAWPDWSLEIWGDGAERGALESAVNARGLRDRVRLPGTTPSPHLVLRGAGLFVLPSRVEGFPNALCEAMAAGLAVLAADCPSGPREIVRDSVDGLLVHADDASALADGLNRLLGDAVLRSRLARRAPEVVERFALERVIGLWDRVLSETTAGRGSSR
jgi:GalNAc-alpha-(1->4)-GalNAc-alpha-(1->3)-diNAcBac-PP-undecaprenol alpha-1,4-N-acetyl-D-galactosaminyltransferase